MTASAARGVRGGVATRRARSRITPRAAVLLAIVVVMVVYSMVPLRIFLQERADLRRDRNRHTGADPVQDLGGQREVLVNGLGLVGEGVGPRQVHLHDVGA